MPPKRKVTAEKVEEKVESSPVVKKSKKSSKQLVIEHCKQWLVLGTTFAI